MATAEDFEEVDAGFVRAIFPPGWTPSGLSSPPPFTWQGMVESGKALTPGPVVLPQETPPAVFAGWLLEWDRLEGDFEDLRAPVRHGRLTIRRYVQAGSGLGPLRKLRKPLLAALAAGSSDSMCFTIQAAKPGKPFESIPWAFQDLVIPFVGN